MDLFINGQYVGYSEGAHNTAEFLLDKYLIEGRNELVAMVRRWSNGTYLDGQTVSLKKADLSIPPQGSLLMPIDFPPDKDVFLNVRYTDKRTGEHVATEQILLHESLPALPSDDRHEMNVDLSDEEIAFTFDNGFSVFFDREKGALRKYVVQGKNLLNEVVVNRHGISSYTEIYRAPFDNDMRYKGAWHRLGFHTYEIGTVKSEIRDIPNGKEICFSYLLIGKRTIASVADRYCVFSDGTIKAETSFEPNRLKNLPRMGKVLELKKEFDKTEYYGKGMQERYPDMTAHAPVGIYRQSGNFGVKMLKCPFRNKAESIWICDMRKSRMIAVSGFKLPP